MKNISKITKTLKFIGISLMLFALMVNPFFIRLLFDPYKNVETSINFLPKSNLIVLVLFECFIFLVGLFVYLKPSYLSEKRKEIFLLLFIFFVCFLFLEITTRLFWKEQDYGYPKELRITDDKLGFKHRPNFHGHFPGKRYRDIEININSKGIRDYEHVYDLKNDRIRILGLGDSVAFGSGVDYEDTYLRQLEKKMWTEGYVVEIIKAGVGGYEFDQQYTYFFEEGYKYHPNIVFVSVILNDIQKVDPNVRKQVLGKGHFIANIVTFIGKYSEFCKLIYSSVLKIKQKIELLQGKDNYDDLYFKRIYGLWKGDSLKRYESKLIEFNTHLRENDIELVLAIFPYTQQFKKSLNYDKIPQNIIINVSETNNITVIDLTEFLDVPNYQDYYLASDTVHLSQEGHKMVKDIIFSKLVNKELITKDAKK